MRTWFHQLGARALIVEVNGGMLAAGGAEYEPVQGARALTRRESIEAAFLAAHELVNQVVAGAWRITCERFSKEIRPVMKKPKAGLKMRGLDHIWP